MNEEGASADQPASCRQLFVPDVEPETCQVFDGRTHLDGTVRIVGDDAAARVDATVKLLNEPDMP